VARVGVRGKGDERTSKASALYFEERRQRDPAEAVKEREKKKDVKEKNIVKKTGKKKESFPQYLKQRGRGE